MGLAAGLATIKIDSSATSGAKSLGLVLGACFVALATLSLTLTVRKRPRPAPPTLAKAGAAGVQARPSSMQAPEPAHPCRGLGFLSARH